MSALASLFAPRLLHASLGTAVVSHPIGMWRLAALIVVVFVAALVITAWVGGARARRRER